KFIISAIFTTPLLLGMLSHIFNIEIFKIFMNNYLQLFFATIVQFYSGYPFYKGAYNNLKTFGANMDVLVSLGTSAAYFYSLYNMFNDGDLYFETSATLITLVLLGKFLEARATGKASDAIRKLLNLIPPTAKVEKNGNVVELSVNEIAKGDILLIGTGDKIPLDGLIVSGEGYIDESAVTGESIPASKKAGDTVIGGTINLSKSFRMKVTKVSEETLLAQIIKIVENAQTSKASIQRFADKVSSYFVPSVVLISLLSFAIWYFSTNNFTSSFMIAISVLVISCPCALGLATPTSIMVASGIGSKNGILFKNSEAIENISKARTIILDKTGTITKGKLYVEHFENISNFQDSTILSIAYNLEKYSSHPIAKAITKFSSENNEEIYLENVAEIAGEGIGGVWNGYHLFIGKNKEAYGDEKINVGLFINSKLSAYFLLSDLIREDAADEIKKLLSMNLDIFMLTGDKGDIAKDIGKKIGIPPENIISDVLPTEKAKYVEEIKKKGGLTIMVGDGINDAPALAVADIGIAMGSGTDIAIDVADVVLVRDELSSIYKAIVLGKKTLENIKQNLFWALCYNAIGIPLAATGMLNPIIAGVAMSLSSVSVVTNALRLQRIYYKSLK
ncbi:MAG: cadmium-translocating P-type ATPase, partial [Calditerrivibrio sp.]|nr:cadmium-translocating P-type ATPase [Calditerrivibrio sp.]